jgi:hypothetical protein
MKKAALFLSFGAIALGGVMAARLAGQQAATPAPPRAPLSTAELEAIPVVPPRAGKSVTKTLFDGKTLQGWQGNTAFWSVDDGAIVGKSNDRVRGSSFLFTTDKYSDFRLTLSSRMVASENHAGVCFWGEIAELGDNKWYTRGPLVVFPNPSMWDYIARQGLRVYRPTREKVTSQYEWVKVEVLAQGNRVRTAFNGVAVMEWREADASRIKEGPIGVQLHPWTGPQEVRYKDIVVETFPKQDKLITLQR